jgi:hypothetical protein
VPDTAAPKKPVICPECGTPDTDLSRAVIRRHRLYALIPRLTLILGLFTIIIVALATRRSSTYASSASQN